MMAHHLIYDPLGLGAQANQLESEYKAHPWARRFKWLKQSWRLRLKLWMHGQAKYRASTLPANASKILYVYDWGAIGDSIMDLSQRQLFPQSIQLDLYMPAKASVLFEGDVRFKNIYRNAVDCPNDYDLIVLHNLSPATLAFKLKRFPRTPFYDVLGFIQGELYARTFFCHTSLARFLGLSSAPMARPVIGNEHIRHVEINPTAIAVAIGALDQQRRQYHRWPELLQLINEQLTQATGRTYSFVLIGSGESAQQDLATFDPTWVQQHCDVRLNLPSLEALQQTIAACAYFIGADGGVMHIAEALDKPGVALFAQVQPDWRLLSCTRLHTCEATHSVNQIKPEEIASAFLSVVTVQTTS